MSDSTLRKAQSSPARRRGLIPSRQQHRAGVVLGGLLALAALASAPAPTRADEARELLRARMEQLEIDDRLRIGGVDLTATDLLPKFYARRNFEPAWRDAKRLDELRSLARLAIEEGLPARDYPLAELESLVASVLADGSPMERVDADILATETLVRVGYHLGFGKVNPGRLDNDWNYARNLRAG